MRLPPPCPPRVRASAPPQAPACPDCSEEPLDLVQPDTQAPELVIGSCPRCGAIWSVGGPPRWSVLGRFRVELAAAC